MGNVLIFVETFEGKIKRATLNALTFGRQAAGLQGGEVHLGLIGSGVTKVAEDLKAYNPDKIFVADDPSLEPYLATTHADAAAAMVSQSGASLVAAVSTSRAKDFLPRLSAKLDAGMVSEVLAVDKGNGGLVFTRPMWAGNVNAKVAVDTNVVVASIRGTEFAPPEAKGSQSTIVPVAVKGDAKGMSLVAFDRTVSARPDLAEAKVIISGGRGLKSKENFKLVEDLADLLGGAVGATRAAVDAGFCPNDLQVGQTGKVVAPQLYIAVGVSGAIQHLAGMKGSKVIVAINKDEEAPIFQVADYGLVDDLFKALPTLIELIQKEKNK